MTAAPPSSTTGSSHRRRLLWGGESPRGVQQIAGNIKDRETYIAEVTLQKALKCDIVVTSGCGLIKGRGFSHVARYCIIQKIIRWF